MLFIAACGDEVKRDKFSGIQMGDRITYGVFVGLHGSEKLKGGGDDEIWFLYKTKNTFTYRSLLDNGGTNDIEVPISDVIWIQKHTKQISMPSKSSEPKPSAKGRSPFANGLSPFARPIPESK